MDCAATSRTGLQASGTRLEARRQPAQPRQGEDKAGAARWAEKELLQEDGMSEPKTTYDASGMVGSGNTVVWNDNLTEKFIPDIYEDGTCRTSCNAPDYVAKWNPTINSEPLSTKQLYELITAQRMTIDRLLDDIKRLNADIKVVEFAQKKELELVIKFSNALNLIEETIKVVELWIEHGVPGYAKKRLQDVKAIIENVK